MRHDVTRPPDAGIEQAIGRIGTSRKYRSIAPETIEDVVRRELERRGGRSTAAALSAARETLHRVAAFYLGEPEYERVGEELEAARLDAASLEAVCLGILSTHVSTRERLPIMADFFRAIFERTGRPRALADLASACTPFSFRWMGLDRTVLYRAYDINADLVGLVSRYFRAEGIPGEAVLRDVLCSPPEEPADVALLLKMYHCLEHRRRGAGWEVVSRVPARWVAVSFPSRNMQGRVADIAGNYRSEILERASAAGWGSEDLELDGESVLLVHKEGS